MAIDFPIRLFDRLPSCTFRKVAAILALGLVIAAFRSFRISAVSSSGLITDRAGPCLAFSLTTFAILWLRYRRSTPGFAGMTAAETFSLGLNTCVHNAAAERQSRAQTYAKAAPIYEAFERGEYPEDDEIKAANVGELEPMLLAQAGHRRQLANLLFSYDEAWAELVVPFMLGPEQLSTAASRSESLARIEERASLHNTFQIEFKAATDEAMKQMKVVMDGTTGWRSVKPEAIEKEVAPIRDHYLAVADNRRDQQDLAAQALSLLHDKPTGVALVKGQPPSLSFRDKAQGARYEEMRQRLVALQTKTDELEQAFDAYQRKTSEVLMEAIRVQCEGR